jgi:ADP-heptose:LPS heptosyltransferase
MDNVSMERRILILKLDAIGDFALFTSVMPLLRKHFSKDTITLGVSPIVAGLAKGSPYVDQIITIDQGLAEKNSDYLKQFTTEVRDRYDIVINAKYTRTWQSDNIVARSRAPVKIGFECGDRDAMYDYRKSTQSLYTTLIPSGDEWKFEIDRYVDLLNTLGAHVSREDLKPYLWLSADELAWAAKFIHEQIPPGRPICIVCPGAGFDSKLWASANYALVLRKLVAEHRFVPLIVGSEKDRKAALEIIRLSDCGAMDYTGKLTLREFAALTSKAGLYVGIDTAGFHLAWILGVPTIGIFGGGHDKRFIPDLPHVNTVRMPMDCYRCYWQCIYDEVKCITSITPAMVLDAVEELLHSTELSKSS